MAAHSHDSRSRSKPGNAISRAGNWLKTQGRNAAGWAGYAKNHGVQQAARELYKASFPPRNRHATQATQKAVSQQTRKRPGSPAPRKTQRAPQSAGKPAAQRTPKRTSPSGAQRNQRTPQTARKPAAQARPTAHQGTSVPRQATTGQKVAGFLGNIVSRGRGVAQKIVATGILIATAPATAAYSAYNALRNRKSGPTESQRGVPKPGQNTQAAPAAGKKRSPLRQAWNTATEYISGRPVLRAAAAVVLGPAAALIIPPAADTGAESRTTGRHSGTAPRAGGLAAPAPSKFRRALGWAGRAFNYATGAVLGGPAYADTPSSQSSGQPAPQSPGTTQTQVDGVSLASALGLPGKSLLPSADPGAPVTTELLSREAVVARQFLDFPKKREEFMKFFDERIEGRMKGLKRLNKERKAFIDELRELKLTGRGLTPLNIDAYLLRAQKMAHLADVMVGKAPLTAGYRSLPEYRMSSEMKHLISPTDQKFNDADYYASEESLTNRERRKIRTVEAVGNPKEIKLDVLQQLRSTETADQLAQEAARAAGSHSIRRCLGFVNDAMDRVKIDRGTGVKPSERRAGRAWKAVGPYSEHPRLAEVVSEDGRVNLTRREVRNLPRGSVVLIEHPTGPGEPGHAVVVGEEASYSDYRQSETDIYRGRGRAYRAYYPLDQPAAPEEG